MVSTLYNIQAFGKNLQQQGGQAAELLQQPRWVAWRARLTESGYSKVPINISTQRPANIRCGALDKHGKPQAVCRYTFDAALAAFAAGQCDGIGIATGEWDGLWVTGIDIDHCLGADGTPKKDLSDIVHMVACAGYCEVSPSATGIHGLVLAHKPAGYACRTNGIEVYSDGQYLTVTGNRLLWMKKPLQQDSLALDFLCANYLAPSVPPKESVKQGARSISQWATTIDWAKKRDAKFAKLWSGKRPKGNESEDDCALMRKLWYYLNGDKEAMIYFFRQSPHAQYKSPVHKKKMDRPDYLERTAEKVIQTAWREK